MTAGGWRKKLSAGHGVRLVGAAVSFCLIIIFFFNQINRAFPECWLNDILKAEVNDKLQVLNVVLKGMQLKSIDMLLRNFPAPLSEPEVVIVDIDEKSLAKEGQWPWSRRRTAELISKIAAARPAVIGLDIVFAEPDRTAPRFLAATLPESSFPLPLQEHLSLREYLRRLPDPDDIFAKTLRSSPVPVVLGYLFNHHDTEAARCVPNAVPSSSSIALRGQHPAPFLHRFDRADVNLPELESAAQGSGFFNIIPDRDAIVRRLPLLLTFEQQPWPCLTFAAFQAAKSVRLRLPLLTAFEQPLHPGLALAVLQNAYAVLRAAALLTGEPYSSLALAMLQAASGSTAVTVESNKNGVRMVQVGERQIPVTPQGEMLVAFSSLPDPERGEGDKLSSKQRLRYVSAEDILHPAFKADDDPASLKNAYVLVGTSALGLFDLISVPVSTVFPGVEFHGQALNTVLTKHFLSQPDWIADLIVIFEIFQVCCISLLLIVLLPRTGAAAGFLLTLGIVGGSIAFSLILYWQLHVIVDLVKPTIAALLLFSSMTFFNYFAEEKNARRLRTTFSQYLAPAVVEEMVKQQDSLVLNGEERELTILFSDIRSFTSMAEKMRPEALCAFLNEYLTPMTAAVMDRRGTVDKFIGDAVMAFWNAPLTTPDHTRHACEAALAMLNELELLNKSWLKRGLPTLRIGIGIHCGLARVGNMGSKQRFEYTVIGDSVNLASRLEGLTKLYDAEILVSGTVCDALHKDFIFRQVDMVRVQGKMEPVTVCQLLGKRDAADARIEEELLCWHEAFDYYSIGDFSAAELLLRHLTGQQPEDSLYSMYLNRCRQLAAAPPEHWDGITVLRSK